MITWSANVSMLFTELPLLERPSAAARAGFRAIESWWPEGVDLVNWVSSVSAAGLRVTSLNCDCGSVERGGACLNVRDHRPQAIEDLHRAIELARTLGVPRLNVPIGHSVPDTPIETQLDAVSEGLVDLAAIARPDGIVLMVEPLNPSDAPGYLIPDTAAGARLVRSINDPGVRLLFDAYHSVRCGEDPWVEIAQHIAIIEHVQYARAPDRGPPGPRDEVLGRVVAELEDQGYRGSIGLEYRPEGPTAASLAFLKPDHSSMTALDVLEASE